MTVANATTMPAGMTLAQGPDATRPGAEAAGRPGKGIVLVYVALALLALTPGVMLKFGMNLGESSAGLQLEELRLGLMDVRFGFGLRFWLAVTGASMMGLLLLYPLRKALAKNRFFGSIGRWFHIHHLLGLAAPVLILYHSNFGLGDTNANVALWAMLCVVISGVVGHFVYGGVSAQYYSGKQQAQEPRDAIMATLARLDAMHGAQQNFIDELKSLEAELLTPRRGVIASIVARLKVEQRHHHLAKSASWLITGAAHELGMSAAQCERLKENVGGQLIAFLRIARAAASGSIREQLWARWRLFHLPAFLIMSIAMTLHIVAVWDIDVWGVRTSLPVIEASARTGDRASGAQETKAIERFAGKTAETRRTTVAAHVEPPAPRPKGAASSRGGKTIDDLLAAFPAKDRLSGPVASARVGRRPKVRKVATSRIQTALPSGSMPRRHVLLAKPKPAVRSRKPAVVSPVGNAKPVLAAVPKPVRVRRRAKRRISALIDRRARAATALANSNLIAPPGARARLLPARARQGAFIKKFGGVWVEGAGFDVTYGGNYNGCASRCLNNRKCVMLEFYRPERKCNLYDKMRPRKAGGASHVGIRQLRLSGIATKFQN